MILRNTFACFLTLLVVLASASLFAGTHHVQWTDTTSGVPGSTFTLSVKPTGGQSYSATLTVDTITSPYIINYITLHLDGGTTPTVSNFNGPTANWLSAEGGDDIDLLKNNKFPQKSWIGFYTDGIVDDGTPDITQGVSLDGGTATWTFNFLLGPGSVLNQNPSIQVGYFSGGYTGSGQYKTYFTQMSQMSLPEPSTLILMLSSMGLLAGAATFGKRLR